MSKKHVRRLVKKIISGETIRLNIGCGPIKKSNFIGIDIVDGPSVDIIFDVTLLADILPENSIDEIYCSHLIEHCECSCK